MKTKRSTNGWIKLCRVIWENDLWTSNEPFDKRTAWIDLLLMAAHEDGTVTNYGKEYPTHKGEVITSQRELAERWRWDRNAVRRFLRELEEKTQILVVNGPEHFTRINVLNYCKYQGSSGQKRPEKRPKNSVPIKEEKEDANVTYATSLLNSPVDYGWDDDEDEII